MSGILFVTNKVIKKVRRSCILEKKVWKGLEDVVPVRKNNCPTSLSIEHKYISFSTSIYFNGGKHRAPASLFFDGLACYSS